MTAHPEHTTTIDTVVALEVTEVLELFVEMCDLFGWPQPLAEALRRVTDGHYELLWLRQDLVRLAHGMNIGSEL
jgi:hypothetical protein